MALQVTLRILFHVFVFLFQFVTKISPFESQYFAEADGSGISLDVRFKVPVGKSNDCYSHELKPGMVLLTDYQVIQNIPDVKLKIAFSVQDGQGQILSNLGQQDSVNFKDMSGTGGWYIMCFHNDEDTVNDKLVQFFLSTYKRDDWGNYGEELSELDVVAETFIASFSSVENSVTKILEDLHYLRAREVSDFALLQSNNDNIYFWSMLNCMILFITGSLQVYFVRKLFDRVGS